MFFNKNLELNCYTNRKFVPDLFPVTKGVNHIPEWFKKIEKQYSQVGNFQRELTTMKGCVGFTDLFKHSVTLPLWTDIDIICHGDKNHPYDIFFADYETFSTTHPQYQRGNFLPDEDYVHLKIDTPWAFHTDKDVYWAMFPATYNHESFLDQVYILPAIVNFKYTNSRTIHMFIKNQEQRIQLEAGTPMVHFVPLSEHKVKVNNIYDKDIYEEMITENYYFSFIKKYQKKIKKLKGK